jgi:hypothetical protein
VKEGLIYNSKWDVYQRALYYDAEGDWKKAHDLVDGLPGDSAAHIHGYLHRKEGDQYNAEYWYRRAGRPIYSGDLSAEWDALWLQYGDG